MQELLNDVVVPALGIGALYGLIGISINLIFAPAGTFNFAQGQIVMLGGLATYSLYENAGLPLVLVILAVAAIGGGVGLVEERIAVWPALRRDPQGGLWVLSTLAASTVLQGFAVVQWGSTPQIVSNFPGLSLTRHDVLGVEIATYYIATLAFGILVAAGLHLFFARTMLGRTVAATAQDREAARLRGISVRNVMMLSFFIGGALAALTGMLAVPLTLATITLGLTLTFRGFMAAAIGGMGSNFGALTGGLLLGFIEQGTQKYWDGGYVNFVMLGVLLALLLVRPQGLLGRAEARRI
jgi:branched-chain amino acid transport system permease protein